MKPYQEYKTDTFTYWGVHYYINPIFTIAHDIEPTKVKMVKVKWNVKPRSELDAKRLELADTSIPLIGIQEDGIIFILDGNHRIRKLYEQGAKEVMVKFITKEQLETARVPDISHKW